MAVSACIRNTAAGLFIVAAIALAALPGAAAPGEEGQGRGPGRGPCAEDVAKLCKEVQHGGGRMMDCLKEHENELSSACKQHVAEMQEKGGRGRGACRDDVSKFCKDVQPGGGRIMECLKEHQNELSPECKSRMASPGGRR